MEGPPACAAPEPDGLYLTAVVEVDPIWVGRLRARHGPRFLQRCFSTAELRRCLARRSPDPGLAVRLAARLALSEACRRLGLITAVRPAVAEVSHDPFGAPRFLLTGPLAAQLATAPPALSLAHSATLAMAAVMVAVPEGRHGRCTLDDLPGPGGDVTLRAGPFSSALEVA